MRLKTAVLLACLFLAVGCTSCAPQPAKTTSAPATGSPSAASKPKPSPTARIDWFWTSADKEAPVFRMVAFINNPGPKAIEGVQVEWIAYDAANSIVGSYKGTEPVVPAGGSIPYVGGAGGANLSGVPVRADIRIASPGRFIDKAAAAYVVSEIQLGRESDNVYNVKAKVTTGAQEAASKDLFA